jgi:hypothetical protein
VLIDSDHEPDVLRWVCAGCLSRDRVGRRDDPSSRLSFDAGRSPLTQRQHVFVRLIPKAGFEGHARLKSSLRRSCLDGRGRAPLCGLGALTASCVVKLAPHAHNGQPC